jgi:dTDP-4-amino-4,6-dideoxygalactose transaminase
VLFESEADLIVTQMQLNQVKIYPRRYFHPSLNTVPYLNNTNVMKISESVASRILCLPLYYNLKNEEINFIILKIMNN